MLNADNELLVSSVSYWEIAIKISLGKYTLNDDFEAFMERQTTYSEFTPLPISVKHAAVVATLPFHHRDPFDRLLAAQALTEAIAIVSVDKAFDLYSVSRIW
jgi:PIN domain nuclease of toxin-antitoxin system